MSDHECKYNGYIGEIKSTLSFISKDLNEIKRDVKTFNTFRATTITSLQNGRKKMDGMQKQINECVPTKHVTKWIAISLTGAALISGILLRALS